MILMNQKTYWQDQPRHILPYVIMNVVIAIAAYVFLWLSGMQGAAAAIVLVFFISTLFEFYRSRIVIDGETIAGPTERGGGAYYGGRSKIPLRGCKVLIDKCGEPLVVQSVDDPLSGRIMIRLSNFCASTLEQITNHLPAAGEIVDEERGRTERAIKFNSGFLLLSFIIVALADDGSARFLILYIIAPLLSLNLIRLLFEYHKYHNRCKAA